MGPVEERRKVTLAQIDDEACRIYDEQFREPAPELLFDDLRKMDAMLGRRLKRARSQIEFRAAKQAFLRGWEASVQRARTNDSQGGIRPG